MLKIILISMKNTYKNKQFISGSFLGFIFLFFLVVFVEWFQNLLNVNLFSGLKYAISLILFTIFWLFFSRKILIVKNYFLLIFLLIVFSILNVSSITPWINQLLGFILTFSFLFIFLMAYSINIREHHIHDGIKNLIFIILILSIFPILSLFTSGESSLRELSINSIGNYSWNFFRELGAYVLILNVGLILALSKLLNDKYVIWLNIAIIFTIFIFITGLKKSMLEAALIWSIFIIISGSLQLRLASIFFLVIVFPIILTVMSQQILYDLQVNLNYLNDVGSDGHVRLAMYLSSFSIALENFPLGSGMGSFGSTASIFNYYSPLYFDYGIDKIGSNGPEFINSDQGSTILDTFWPHILGEMGFIGLMIFILLFFYPSYSSAKLLFSNKDSSIVSLCFITFLVPIVIGIDGLALYTPEVPMFILFHSGLVGFCLRIVNTKNLKL